jgi:heterodisulfide reductase subunit A
LHGLPGRADERFIWHAFAKGTLVILVSGCHIGDCHYIDANHWSEKRIAKIQRKMEKQGLRQNACSSNGSAPPKASVLPG